MLEPDEAPAVNVINPDGRGPFVLICEHASNAVPRRFSDLGLDPEVLQSHAAWDPGAIEVARALSEKFSSPLVAAGYSRLIYDVNRPPDSEEAIRAVSERYQIPANRALSTSEKQARARAIYHPFHDAVSDLLDRRRQSALATAIVTVHTFNDVFNGVFRDVEFGILHDQDARLAHIMFSHAGRYSGFETRINEPYGPADGVTHTLRLHAIPRGLPNVMLEIRNDLVRTAAGQADAAGRIAAMLEAALEGLETARLSPDGGWQCQQ